MPKVIKSEGREMILKMKEFCEAEMKNKDVLIPLNNVRARVAAMTGVLEKTVSRITKEGKVAASTSSKIVTPGKSRPHSKKIDLDDFEENWIKPVLYNIIKTNKDPPKYAVDELLKSHNHEIIRLPPYHCYLNPIEKIWSLVKRKVADKNIAQDAKNIVELTEAAFESITAEDWKIQCKHVEHIEEEYSKNDGLMDMEMERFIISVESDSDTDSDKPNNISENSDSDCSMSGITPIDEHSYFKRI